MLNLILLGLLSQVLQIYCSINPNSETEELLNLLIQNYSQDNPKSVTIIQEKKSWRNPAVHQTTFPIFENKMPLERYLWDSEMDSNFTIKQMGHRHECKHNIVITTSVAQTLKIFDWIFPQGYVTYKRIYILFMLDHKYLNN